MQGFSVHEQTYVLAFHQMCLVRSPTGRDEMQGFIIREQAYVLAFLLMCFVRSLTGRDEMQGFIIREQTYVLAFHLMCLVRSLTGRELMQGFSNFLGRISPSESRNEAILLPATYKKYLFSFTLNFRGTWQKEGLLSFRLLN